MPQWTNPKDAESSHPSPQKPLASWYAQGLSDGLGDRLLMFDNSAGPSLELLRFRADLAQLPEFEAALREQVQRLAFFQHPAFARVRSVQRLEPDADLALISNYTPGKRLSEVLHRARGPALAAALIKQLAPALALFQQQNSGVSHGLLTPDRIVVSPEGRLTIVEHVVGSAIDTLNLRIAALESMGIALPPAEGDAQRRLDAGADWYQLALVAVSVMLGRPVTAGELPHLEALLDRIGESNGHDGTPVSPMVRQWLDRALRISGERIESGADACQALDELLRKERPRDAAPRVESPRPAPVEPPAPAPPMPAPVVYADPELAVVPPVTVAAPVQPHMPEPAPVPPPVVEPQPQQLRVLTHPGKPSAARARASAFEQEAWAGRQMVFELESRATVHEPPATAEPEHPARSISRPIVAALVLLVLVEAGAIAWLARALWSAPVAPMVVATDASGEGVRVNSRSTGAAPLQLAAAADLGWVRVTSPPAEGILGAKLPAGAGGTIRISSPIPLKVLEGSRQVGAVPGSDLKLSTGRHELELVNAPLGYRSTQVLDIEAGQTVAVHVAPPHGWLTIDASPWAEVTIDGRAVGRTPLGPLALALGEHTLTFRHPAGSSDRQKVTVKSQETARVIGKLRF